MHNELDFTYCFINPWFITGLTEAEGNFSSHPYSVKKKDGKKKIQYNFRFRIEMLNRDKILLLKIQEYFGCGN